LKRHHQDRGRGNKTWENALGNEGDGKKLWLKVRGGMVIV